jgi:ABC-type lipoprotein release transport system permease subunit
MADRYWGSVERAIAGRVAIDNQSGPPAWLRVVGVAGDVKRPDLEGTNPQIYLPARQRPVRAMAVMVRAADPDAVIASVRNEVRAADVDVPVHQLRTLRDAFDEELSASKILVGMFASFGVLALVFAASGLYGVIAYSVSRRVQEIGIRMALGAAATDIRRLIVRQTFWQIALGSAIGFAGGAAIAFSVASILFPISPSDPMTYVTVGTILMAVATLATWVPVQRAMRIDPLLALRAE